MPPPRSGPSGGDIAGLVLARGDLPESAGSARLLDEAIPRGSAVDVFGYPDSPSRPDSSANSRLIARGAVGGGLIQLDADGDTAIRTQAGFSGSPVVMTDEAGDAVVGMLAAASRDGTGGDAYAVPVAALAEGWPDVVGALSLPPCPYKGLSPFTADDAVRCLYVGREDDVAELRRAPDDQRGPVPAVQVPAAPQRRRRQLQQHRDHHPRRNGHGTRRDRVRRRHVRLLQAKRSRQSLHVAGASPVSQET